MLKTLIELALENLEYHSKHNIELFKKQYQLLNDSASIYRQLDPNTYSLLHKSILDLLDKLNQESYLELLDNSNQSINKNYTLGDK